MRIVFKILLFPVVLVLSMLVWFCRAMCWFSSGVLSLASFVFFALGILALFEKDYFNVGVGIITAWLLSPFGLPLAAEWIIDRVENVKDTIAAM